MGDGRPNAYTEDAGIGGASLLFKVEALELQGTAVLGDGADGGIRRSARQTGLDLEKDLDLGSCQGSQVLDDLLGDLGGIASDAGGVEADEAVKAERHGRGRGARSARRRRGG